VEITAVQSMLQALAHHSNELLVAGDSASSVLVKTREGELGLRLTTVQQLMISRQSEPGSLHAQSEFHRACSETEQTCEQVETTLGDAVLTDDADEAVLTTLMAHVDQSLVQLVGCSPVHLAYVLPLSATDLERLRHLHSRSRALLCRTKDQYRTVHRRLLSCYDVARKCDEWLQFVAQIEHELSSPIAGSFEPLLTQRKTLEARCVILSLLINIHI